MTERANPLDLSGETARVTEEDLQAGGRRKPASDEVDSERAAAARDAEPGSAPAAIERSAE